MDFSQNGGRLSMVAFMIETLEKVRSEIKKHDGVTKSYLYANLKIKYPTLSEITNYLKEKKEIESIKLGNGREVYR